MAKPQSVEPNIADLANGWLKSLGLDYKLEQEALNSEIDNALTKYHSKAGGFGGNRPDAKLLLCTQKSQQVYPVLIEYKGYQDKLVKLDSDGNVENRSVKNEPLYKNINGYAVNGAVHYANAILHHTAYTGIIAIGITGHKDENTGELKHQIGVYYVAKSNLGAGQKVGDFDDLSFLAPQHFDQFIEEKIQRLSLTPEELDKIKARREAEIEISLKALNNDIYQNEKGLSESDRVYLVAASIIATIGIPGKVAPLEKIHLRSLNMEGERDGDIIIRRIKAFLKEKNLPQQKQDLIIRTLSNTLLTENINKVKDGESQLKRVFGKIVDDLGIYYKIGLTTDFTGRLFNEMYSWLGFTQDKLNDVVLTPAYVATLLVKLARVNKDSYVWDFATGSAGLLVAAMNEMLGDAKDKIKSPEDLLEKEAKIKAEQLLGLELLPSVYMLAILNMILMGDGSANIINKDSLSDFNGKYGFGKTNEKFPADAFILNPPYSATGNGMVFVQKALSMMSKGYAAVIIQNSAGSGKARDINREILKKNTLLASIKMPLDLFIGKSSVQTNIYVFKVGEAHEAKSPVRFIDFSNDGYTRTNRKKASNNLRDTDNARDRYEELVNLVKYGAGELKIFSKKEFHEGKIDPENGADWNQSAPIDTRPTLADFQKTVGEYLAWEVAQLLRKPEKDNVPGKSDHLIEMLEKVEWKEFRIGDLFEIKTPKKRFDANKVTVLEAGDYPYVVRTALNNGIRGYIEEDIQFLNEGNTISFGQDTATVFYQDKPYFTGDKIKVLKPMGKMILNRRNAQFILPIISRAFSTFAWGSSSFKVSILENVKIRLPVKGGDDLYFEFMEKFITKMETRRLVKLEDYMEDHLGWQG